MIGAKPRGMTRLAVRQLRHHWGLSMLATLGVAIAVVSLVILVGLGAGVYSDGEAQVEHIGGDLWLSAGTTTVGPSAIGHVEHSITDAHALTRALQERDDVRAARAFAFQTAYVSPDAESYDTMTVTGVTGDGRIFSTVAGDTFSGGDAHYAGGSYDGPMSGEVLLDERAAAQLGVAVGDEIQIGGTLRAADEHAFTVTGISNDIANLVGTPTIVLHLGELHQITGTTNTDPATAIIVATNDDPGVVRSELEADYPGLTVRTNHEQFQSILQRQSTVLAGAATLIVLGIGSGIAIVANVFGLMVATQRRSLTAIRAIGVPPHTLLGIVTIQGVLIGTIGMVVGLLLAIPAAWSVNYVIADTIGYDGIITVEGWMLPVVATVAVGVGLLGTAVAGWWLGRMRPIDASTP